MFKLVLFRERGQHSVGLIHFRVLARHFSLFLCDYHGLQTSPIYGLSQNADIAGLAQSIVDAGRENWQGPYN